MPNIESSNLYFSLPVSIQHYIFEYIDLETWMKVIPLVCKNWKDIRNQESLWRSFYLNLHTSTLWQYLLKEANNPTPNIDHMLYTYFSDIAYDKDLVDPISGQIKVTFRDGIMYFTVYNFFKFIIENFKKSKFSCSKTPDSQQLFKEYFEGFAVDSCYARLQNIKNNIPALHNQIITAAEPVTLENYQVIMKDLAYLRKTEKKIITLFANHENTYNQRPRDYYSHLDADDYFIFFHSKWFSEMTEQELHVLEAQFNLLWWFWQKWIYIKESTVSNEVKEEDKILSQRIETCFNKLSESTILNGLFYTHNCHSSEFILTCLPLLAKINDKNLLKLTLETTGASVSQLFDCNEFRQRLLQLPNAGDILNQLAENKVNFLGELLTNKESEHIGKTYAKNILAWPEFTSILTNNQLVNMLTLDTFSFETFKQLLDKNRSLVQRLAESPELILEITKAEVPFWVIPSYSIGKDRYLIDNLDILQATALALKGPEAVEPILKNKQIAILIWEPFYLQTLKKNYSYLNLPIINHHLEQYKQFIQRAEKGDETALKILLEKAHVHLEASRLNHYVNLIKSFELGLDEIRNQLFIIQEKEEHLNFLTHLKEGHLTALTKQNYLVLYTLAMTHKYHKAAELLLTNSLHLKKLEKEIKLNTLLSTHPELIHHFDKTPEKLISLANTNPEIIINAYQINTASFKSPHLNLIFYFAIEHKNIAHALLANDKLRNKFGELKERLKLSLPIKPNELVYINQFVQILQFLGDRDSLVIKHALEGNVPILKLLAYEARNYLEYNNIDAYLKNIKKVYSGLNSTKDRLFQREFFQSHYAYLSKQPYNTLLTLALKKDDVAAEILFKLPNPISILQISTQQLNQLSNIYEAHTLAPLFSRWKIYWEKIKKKDAFINKQKSKLYEIFQQLNDYSNELSKKAEKYLKDNDTDRAEKYVAKSKAVTLLAQDLKREADTYFNQRIDHRLMKSRHLYEKLNSTIDDHLNSKKHPDLVAHTKWKTELANHLLKAISAICWVVACPIMAVKWMCTQSPIFRFKTNTESMVQSEIKPAIKNAIRTTFAPSA